MSQNARKLTTSTILKKIRIEEQIFKKISSHPSVNITHRDRKTKENNARKR